jgi:hypothetical protein
MRAVLTFVRHEARLKLAHHTQTKWHFPHNREEASACATCNVSKVCCVVAVMELNRLRCSTASEGNREWALVLSFHDID